MPGTNAGTGYPLTLRCAKCKSTWRREYGAMATNLIATGRTKPRGRNDKGGMRTTTRMIEYRCLDCGHVGWTKHIDAERLIRRLNLSDCIGEA